MIHRCTSGSLANNIDAIYAYSTSTCRARRYSQAPPAGALPAVITQGYKANESSATGSHTVEAATTSNTAAGGAPPLLPIKAAVIELHTAHGMLPASAAVKYLSARASATAAGTSAQNPIRSPGPTVQ